MDSELEMQRKIAAMPKEKRALIKAEALRCADVAHNIDSIIRESDEEFKKDTALDKKDWAFLGLCTGFQVARQCFLTQFEKRLSDQEAAKLTWGHETEASNRMHRLYHPSLEEIMSNPVPFDAMMGSKKFDANLSGKTHRYIPGHDPVLGYIIGTMNILTSTVTGFDGQSFHVKTGFDGLGRSRDCLHSKADIGKILAYTKRRIFDEGTEGLSAFAAALVKEHIHLKSDLKTSESLPLPFISSLDVGLAQTLSSYGLDMLNAQTIGKQASVATIINLIVAMLHRMMMPKNTDVERYKAKTKKIIAYSNAIATTGNAVYSALTEQWDKLDVGGGLVTLYNIITASKFITDLQASMRIANLEKHLNS